MGENRITDLRRLLTTPGWRRSLLLRRSAALILVLVAGFSALRSAGAADPQVTVFTRAVAAGEAVAAGVLGDVSRTYGASMADELAAWRHTDFNIC